MTILRVISLGCFLLLAVAARATPVINEVQSVNTSLPDHAGQLIDWVELHNPTGATINLDGYYLSDSLTNRLKFQFGDVSITAGGFLVVWTGSATDFPVVDDYPSGQVRATTFAISSGGEPIVLMAPDGETVIDQFPAKPITPGSTLGRGTGSNFETLFFYANPTKGTANTSAGVLAATPDPPVFSVPGGMFTGSSLNVAINLPEGVANGVIRYTLDGSDPTTNSPIYSSPLTLNSSTTTNTNSFIPTNNNNNPGPPFYEGWQPPNSQPFRINVLRARVFQAGANPSRITTASYLMHANGTNRYSLPVVSIASTPSGFFSSSNGIYVPPNMFERGSDWERPGHIEFFENDGTLAFSGEVGVRIQGNTTRSRPRKSLRIYARNPAGASTFDYRLFPQKEIDRFDTFLLRNGGNDWGNSMFRDALITSLAAPSGVDVQAFRPVVVFLSGEYWGIHNVRDRIDDGYFFHHFGLGSSAFSQIEMTPSSNSPQPGNGDPSGVDDFQDILNVAASTGFTNTADYVAMANRIDIDNFIDYNAHQIWSGNTDWPGNNYRLWRATVPDTSPGAHPRHDGRWRWILFDADFGLGADFTYVPGHSTSATTMAQFNSLAHATALNGTNFSNKEISTRLLRRLLQNNEFRTKFITRFADLLNTTLSVDVAKSKLAEFRAIYEPGMVEHTNRWRQPVVWTNDLNRISRYLEVRPGAVQGHIQGHFNLSGMDNVTVNVSGTNQGIVRVNTLNIDPSTPGVPPAPYPWTGTYFRDVPVEVSAQPKPGHKFVSWTQTAFTTGTTTNSSDSTVGYTGWGTGTNRGTGFNAWTLTDTAAGSDGFFIGNGGGSRPIHSATADGRSFGIFAHVEGGVSPNASARAIRPFGFVLNTNQTFSAKISPGGFGRSSQKGVEFGTSVTNWFGFFASDFDFAPAYYFRVGNTTTRIDSANFTTDVNHTFDVRVTRTSTNSYNVTLERGNQTFTTNLTSTNLVTRATFFSAGNPNGDDTNNLYFNQLQVTTATTASNNTVTTTDPVVNLSLAGDVSLTANFEADEASALVLEVPGVVQADEILPDLVVRAITSSGDTDPGFSGEVTLVVSGPDNYSATYTATSVAGVATFSGLTLPGAGQYSLTASSGGLSTATASGLTAEARSVLHLWDFNDSTTLLEPQESIGGGAVLTEPGETTAFVSGTSADFADAHLRVNNPLGASLTFLLPTTSHQNIRLTYDTRRSGQGAGVQVLSYTLDGETFVELATYDVFDAAPQPIVFDFSSVEGVADNPDFAVRIEFELGGGGTGGNNRFDNFTLTGTPVPGPPVVQPGAVPEAPMVAGESRPTNLNTVFTDSDSEALSFSASSSHPAIATVALQGDELTITALAPGETLITLTADDGDYTPVSTDFVLLVYPAAQELALGPYTFTAWDALAPALTYPANTIFLQGTAADPGVDAPLLRAYQIPAADAASAINVDFPYNATARTRLNGLGDDGIAFINTGRSRDLGGALVALDTTDLTAGTISFTAGTVLANTRIYALRLQYRVGDDGPFADVLDAQGNPVVYLRNATNGHSQQFTNIPLPADALDEPYVQLLWRYHFVSGDSGARAQLRLDDITVAAPSSSEAVALQFESTPQFYVPDGSVLAPVTVRALANDGSLDTAFNGSVTLTLQGAGSLSGTTSVQAVNGVAAFNNLMVTGTTGTFSLAASSGDLAVGTTPSFALTPVVEGFPLFLPGGNAAWDANANWSSESYPNAAAASALVLAPASGNRNIGMTTAVTVGDLRIDNGASTGRNRVAGSGSGTLTFNGGASAAQLRIDGTGTGFVEFENTAGIVLATDLDITVNNTEGDGEYGALRLRETWSGSGGLTKKGPGLMTLTGGGKNFAGPIMVQQGVLAVTEPSAMGQAESLVVQDGGQLRLTSAVGGDGAPRVYTFGGTLSLAGGGRSGVAEGENLGVSGALRYEPGSFGNEAVITSPVHVASAAIIHASGDNLLRFSGAFTGSADLTKSGGGALVLGPVANGFTGEIDVETGSLVLDGADLGANTSRLTLGGGTSLRGAGRWGGELRVSNSASVVATLGSEPAETAPLRVGSVNANAANTTVVLEAAADTAPGTYPLLQVDGTISGSLALAAAPENYPNAQLVLSNGTYFAVLSAGAPAEALEIDTNPLLGSTAGASLPVVSVRAITGAGATAVDYVSEVVLTITGPNSFSQTYTANAVVGVASFSGIVLPASGEYTFSAASGSIATATGSALSVAGPTVLTVSGTGTWTTASQWDPAVVPDSNLASVVINEVTADRNVNVTAPITVSSITFNNGASSFRNRIRNNNTSATTGLTLQAASGNASITVNGTGVGHANLDFGAPTQVVLASDVVLDVQNTNPEGNAGYGALRLQGNISGTGGLIKRGPGLAGLSGSTKSFSGDIVIEQGALAFTEPVITELNTTSYRVLAGGQIKLTSAGERVYGFKGPLELAGSGRSGVDDLAGHAISGALRYDPGSSGGAAVLTNNVHLVAAATFHATEGNAIVLTGPLTGSADLVKAGPGDLVLGEADSAFTGGLTVNEGAVLLDDGTYASAGALALAGGTTLGGQGTWGGALEAAAGSSLEFVLGEAPEADAFLTVASADFAGATTVTVVLDPATTPGTYPLLAVSGQVNGAANLQLAGSEAVLEAGELVLADGTLSYVLTGDGGATGLVIASAPEDWTWTEGFDEPITVSAVGGTGLLDPDFTGTITLTFSGAGEFTQSFTADAVTGVATFTNFNLPAGSYTVSASSGELIAASTPSITYRAGATFLPAANAVWGNVANWDGGVIPNSTTARAIIPANTAANRNVTNNVSGTTVAALTFENGATTFRQRFNAPADASFNFQSADGPALLRVNGTGTGFVEFNFENANSGVVLTSDLEIQVNNTLGDTENGALRLRYSWSGPGGVIKTGLGMASFTTDAKTFTGAVEVQEGVIAFTAPSSPAAASGLEVQSGGQVRFTSSGTNTFGIGGQITLAGTGRSGVEGGEGLGVLGALRYDPGATADNIATFTNTVNLAATAQIHVPGGSILNLAGALATTNNTHNLIKSGGGLLALDSASAGFTGGLQIDRGTLLLDDVAFNATSGNLVLADAATLAGQGAWGGTLQVQAGANLSFDLAAEPDASAPLAVGALNVSGASTVTLELAEDTVPGTYPLLAAGAAPQGTGNLSVVLNGGPAFTSTTLQVTGNVLEVVLSDEQPTLADRDAWNTLYDLTGADALDTADPDGDGIPNLFERAFGLNPTVVDSGLPVTTSASGGTFSVTYPVARNQSDITVTAVANTGLEKGDSPQTWTPLTPQLIDDSHPDYRVFRASIPAENPTGSIQLRVGSNAGSQP